jgi:acyl-CoA thioesterase FadM
MGKWTETYRGTVYRWEVDHVDHFTVAYYFQRFEDATATMLAALGVEGSGSGADLRAWLPADCRVRYLKELRVADILHVRSGVLGVDDGAIVVGHQVFNSGSGDLCTTVEFKVLLPGDDGRPAPLDSRVRRAAEAYRVPWDGPTPDGQVSAPDDPAAEDAAGPAFVDSARDTLKPWEVNAAGRAALPAYIHRFSAANSHALAAFGMTPAYMREVRRAFSTFEFRLQFGAPLGVGDLVRVRSAVAHVGNSSLRLVHRMTGGSGGAMAAVLEQSGVHLDVDARRPAPLPPLLRDRARAMLPTASSSPVSGA